MQKLSMGKPSEREGRKAMDLKTNVYDSQVALVFNTNAPGFNLIFYRWTIQPEDVHREDKT